MTKDVFGNQVITDERGENLIIKTFEYPQSNVNSMKLFRFIELMNVLDSGINFPSRIIQNSISISPTKENIKKYFSFEGIRKFIDEQQLFGKKFFIKPEIKYQKEGKYPVLTIHFYFISENENGYMIKNDFELIDKSMIYYLDINQFTDSKLSDLEQLVEVNEIKLIPCIPLTYIEFEENGKIQDLKFDTYWA